MCIDEQYIKFKNPYLSNINKLSILQRRILVYSIAYYELNDTIVPDLIYEKVSKQYLQLSNWVEPEELERAEYYYVFYDYDGSTGFDLIQRLCESDKEKLFNIANYILHCVKK